MSSHSSSISNASDHSEDITGTSNLDLQRHVLKLLTIAAEGVLGYPIAQPDSNTTDSAPSPFKAKTMASPQGVTKKPKLGHQDNNPGHTSGSSAEQTITPCTASEPTAMDQILSSLRLGGVQVQPAQPLGNLNVAVTKEDNPPSPTDGSALNMTDAEILAKLSQQQAKLAGQQRELAARDRQYQHDHMDNISPVSTAFTPITDTFNPAVHAEEDQAASVSTNSILQVQQQRITALQNQLAHREQQLTVNAALPTPNPATSTSNEGGIDVGRDSSPEAVRRPSVFNAAAPPFMARGDMTEAHPVSPTTMSETRSVDGYNMVNTSFYGPRNWPGMMGPPPNRVLSASVVPQHMTANAPFADQFPTDMATMMQWQAPQGMNMTNMMPFPRGQGQGNSRRGGYGRRATTGFGAYSYGTGSTANQPIQYQPGMYNTPTTFQARAGSVVSSDGTEFPSGGAPLDLSSLTSSTQALQTYVHRNEPVNYRRMLDKTVNCNWKYIVDKIVHSNDQQASIFLQQKLKVGTAEQKYDIIESIIAQAYPLMINRFGNFLVQRCFEHGTPDQVNSIANSIRGNTLSLSCDPFGCHVIQKAFDSVPEEFRIMMVHELLRRIPETVIHRYACHVWQKLFELRWAGDPPNIMKYVNDALQGMWHEVALGETGSLVVQNIFENCVEDEKRQCIEEVLNNIDLISHGQFGNWCIQHICEHGQPNDMRRAIEHILHRAVDYSIDQYASKVVEKCLKIKGPEFLAKYLTIVCEARPERPRMPLIDIAGDQYGNYLIQYILGNAGPHHREMVASHIRKHMVSLRGSKFGSRVAMLCCNPAHVTRPGPGAGVQVHRFGAPGQGRFGGLPFN